MLQIQNTLISPDLLEKRFVCDLPACKGACCIEGDSGAPLLKEEVAIIEKIYEKVKLFMCKEGISAIEKNGKFSIDEEGETVTPLVNHKECSYMIFEKSGITKCAFELAFEKGKTDFKKPISCHLYPVRVSKYNEMEAVNFHEWKICDSAKKCGIKSDVKVYQFVKEALIRKFGTEWYEELEMTDKIFAGNKNTIPSSQ